MPVGFFIPAHLQCDWFAVKNSNFARHLSPMKRLLLTCNPLSEASLDLLRETFDVLPGPTPEKRAEIIRTRGAELTVVLTNGTVGFTGAEMDALPKLEIVCAMGAGYENIDVAHARTRGIVVANGTGTNDDCVADHAFALLLAAVRGVPSYDAACRAGVWREALPMRPNFSGKRMGIVGLGTIGAKMAKRGLGFDLEIGYHNRKPRSDVPHTYFDSVLALAEWADYLMIATPGGADTRHLVSTAVLNALGPAGYVVNISRGSVVDTQALADALRDGRLGGAGLDVYESEPKPPTVLFDLPNVVLTPHTAGTSPEAIRASVLRFIENATRHFAGQAPVSPV
jgi:lactate dehydrogenase-like 2-hydroxyacid dehydrogenase